jgi:lysosomal Pro-X carboxypeptidase
LASELNGLVVYAEHRYFGESWPFDKSIAFTAPYDSYLTLEQVMMDYVEFIKYIKYSYEAEDCPVIVFGGSYGGMLAAWLRMKFPHMF